MRAFAIAISYLAAFHVSAACAADCLTQTAQPFGKETVRLARSKSLSTDANFAVFVAPLAVNTDGAPTSYHPLDPLGTKMAINRFDNGIGIHRISQAAKPLSKLEVFKQWRDNNWVAPKGYKISWQNVIAGRNGKPCVFTTGQYKGYFGSLTALKNGLAANEAGECQVDDQLDQRVIPAIVLRGGKSNPLYAFGARPGDMVMAINPSTQASVFAVIGDTGDGDRIGEGSVALNMALLGKTTQPSTYAEAEALDTGSKDMIVAVLPGSRAFKKATPYTPDNIRSRVEAWSAAHGYKTAAGLQTVIKVCSTGL